MSFSSSPHDPSSNQPPHAAWGTAAVTSPTNPGTHPVSTGTPKPLIAALGVVLFISGCVSGSITTAAMKPAAETASPRPTATVTVTAKPSPSKTPSASPSQSSTPTPSVTPTPTEPVSPPSAPEPPAPQPPAPEPPVPAAPPAADPTALTQTGPKGSITISPFKAATDDFSKTSKLLCTSVTFSNTSAASWKINPHQFELGAPDHTRSSPAWFSTGRRIELTTLEPGDTLAGDVCFDDTGQRGDYLLIWDELFDDSIRWNITIP